MKTFTAIGCLSYFLIGIAHVVLGSVLEPLLAHYGKSYDEGSLLIFNQFAGFLVGVLATPALARVLSGRGILLCALAFLGAGELTYSFLPAWPIMLAAAPLAGFGFGMVEAAIGSLVIELAASNKAVAMSRLEVFFGLGALAMPAIAGGLIAIGIWYSAFPLIVLMTAVTAILWMRLSFGSLNTALDRKAGKEASAEERRSSRSLPLLGMMIAFFVLYVGSHPGNYGILGNNVHRKNVCRLPGRAGGVFPLPACEYLRRPAASAALLFQHGAVEQLCRHPYAGSGHVRNFCHRPRICKQRGRRCRDPDDQPAGRFGRRRGGAASPALRLVPGSSLRPFHAAVACRVRPGHAPDLIGRGANLAEIGRPSAAGTGVGRSKGGIPHSGPGQCRISPIINSVWLIAQNGA